MEELLDRCCGIDVHQKTLTACIMIGFGKSMHKEIKTFSTMTDGIEALGEWLKSHDIKHAAIESTGVYWKPVFNILAEDLDLMLVNARHVKNVPGRKSDVKDSEWICKLLKTGLLARSFIPPEEMRNLRDLTRHRSQLVANVVAEKNRLIKFLEAANIKLSTVLSDVMGKTGTAIIEDIANGVSDPQVLVKHIRAGVKASHKEFERALTGRVTDHTRFMLRHALSHIRMLETLIKELEEKIEAIVSSHQKESELLQTIPGISKTVAASIMAEIGVDMDQFPTEQHLASWAGLSPGSYESAGKKKAPASCRDLAS